MSFGRGATLAQGGVRDRRARHVGLTNIDGAGRRPYAAAAMDEQRARTREPDEHEITALRAMERESRDRGARTYLERIRAADGAFRYEAELRTLLHHLALHRDDVVLDAGCGVGRMALEMAPRVRLVVCTDLSPGAIEVLRERAGQRGLRNVEAHVGDLATLPADLGPFDAVCCFEVLQHVPGPEHVPMLERLRAVLKPGGRCLVSVRRWQARRGGLKEGLRDRTYWHYFLPGELRARLAESGFRDVRVRGAGVLPGAVAMRLPSAAAPVEVALSTLPLVPGTAGLILGLARR